MISDPSPAVLRRMIRVGVREVTIPVVTVLAVLCGGCFPPVLDPNTSKAVHVPDTRWDVALFLLCFAGRISQSVIIN